MRSVPVKHVPSGRKFHSILEASKVLQMSPRVIRRSLNSDKGEFIRIKPEHDRLRIPEIPGPQKFRPIPGYEGLYSMSNKGLIRSDKFNRIKSVSTNASNQHYVVLYKNSMPHMWIVETLFSITWLGKKPRADIFHRVTKPIKCIDDNKVFGSRTECCTHYRIDYTKFLHALRSAEGKSFTCNGHTFIDMYKEKLS